ncbi:MAG: acetyl-CoA carboxylase biotin carboxyl carrier protein [Victivallales bacterium]|nr:acetyl-CoA carboxylase biotin carboxyl carrier protein [Victivallales bacterium]
MKIEEIRAIVNLMSDHDLTEFKIEAEEMRLCIRRGHEQVLSGMPHGYSLPAAPPAAAPTLQESKSADEEMAETIDSPIVGTFYAASAPDQPAFVSVGTKVTPDTVVCIIEAMKVMNEIKAEKSGTIKKILVENAHAVEFGQPLFVIG